MFLLGMNCLKYLSRDVKAKRLNSEQFMPLDLKNLCDQLKYSSNAFTFLSTMMPELSGDMFWSLERHSTWAAGIVYSPLSNANFTHVAVSLPHAKSKFWKRPHE